MTKEEPKRTTRRKLLVVLIIGIGGLATGVGTTALFSDTETTTSQISTGTLDLAIGDSSSATISVTAVKPGTNGTASGTLANNGTIDGVINRVNITVTNSTEGANPEPETDVTEPGDLEDTLTLSVIIDDDGNLNNTKDQTLAASGNLSSIAGNHERLNHSLANGGNAELIVRWEVPSTAGNDIQGDTVAFDIRIELEQSV